VGVCERERVSGVVQSLKCVCVYGEGEGKTSGCVECLSEYVSE
jgi:hypothetical protein